MNYFADYAWLPHGWAGDTRIDLAAGNVATVQADAARAQCEYLGRYVLPGMPNLHSHAFQRAMAGLADRQGSEAGSLWAVRGTMAGVAVGFRPDDLRANAAQRYVQMAN